MKEFTIYLFQIEPEENLYSPTIILRANIERIKASSLTVLVHPVTKKFRIFKHRHIKQAEYGKEEIKLRPMIEQMVKYMDLVK